MKNLVLFIVLLISCDNELVNVERSVDKEEEDVEKVLIETKRMGFNTQNYDVITIENVRYVFIEKEILFNIDLTLKKQRNKQWSTSANVISSKEVRSVTYAFSGFMTSWMSAITRAGQEWTDIKSCLINIKPETFSLDSADIIYGNFNLVEAYGKDYESVIAFGEAPLDGKPGRHIYFNTGSTGTLSPSEKIFTVVHELGHNLGFRHTNWFDRLNNGYSGFGNGADSDAESWSKARHILGSPWEYNSNSVMNAYVAPWSGFSSEDENAARALYFYQGPVNIVTINPISTGLVGDSLKITLNHKNYYKGPFTYEWFIRENNPKTALDAIWTSFGYSSDSITFVPTSTMNHELGVIVKNSSGSITSIAVGKSIIVH